MTKEQIINKANKFASARIIKQQTNISGDLAIAYARDAALDMAAWMQEQIRQEITDKACSWLKRELAEPMPDDLYQQWCEEKLEDFKKDMLNENNK